MATLHVTAVLPIAAVAVGALGCLLVRRHVAAGPAERGGAVREKAGV